MGAPTGHLPQRFANGILFRNSAPHGYLERMIIARSNIDHTQPPGGNKIYRCELKPGYQFQQ